MKRSFISLLLVSVCCLCFSQQKAFVEKDGLVVIELEDTDFGDDWQKTSKVPNCYGSCAIEWIGAEHFSNTSFGRFEIGVKINNPGVYGFDWRIAVGHGDSGTEHNDSWLGFDNVDEYWGEKATGSKVKPKPDCGSDGFNCPKGASKDGYFKLFGGGLNQFKWKAVTSDGDDHRIFIGVSSPRIIKIKIAARSSYHVIDRLVMYNTVTVNLADARKASNVSSQLEENTAVNSVAQEVGLKVFPNPTNDFFTISANTIINGISILNLTGHQVVAAQRISASNKEIDVSGLQDGIYLVKIDTPVGLAYQRVVKK